MHIDSLNEFCDATALNTGVAGNYNVGSTIDLGLAPGEIGSGKPLYLVIQASTAFAGGGSVAFRLVTDAGATPSTTAPTVHVTTPYFAAADGAEGATLAIIALPQKGNTYEQYLGIQQLTITAAFTAGAINAFLTDTPAAWQGHADGVPTPA